MITILGVDLFLDISYCPQSFLYCFKGEIGSTANVHTISCQVILNIFQDFSKVFVMCFSLIFFMFCRCHFAQVKSLVLFQKGKWQRTLPTISRQVFLLPFTERGRASFQEDKWRNCHRHISWTGLNSPPNFCCFVQSNLINLHAFCPGYPLYSRAMRSQKHCAVFRDNLHGWYKFYTIAVHDSHNKS